MEYSLNINMEQMVWNKPDEGYNKLVISSISDNVKHASSSPEHTIVLQIHMAYCAMDNIADMSEMSARQKISINSQPDEVKPVQQQLSNCVLVCQ